MCAIKEFSVKAKTMVQEAKDKESDPELIKEYDSIIAQMIANIPTQKLREDTNTLNKLYFTTIYLGSPQLAKIVMESNEKQLEKVAKKMKSDHLIQRGADVSIIIERMSKAAQDSFSSKIDNYLNLFNNAGNGNYIKAMSLAANYVFAEVRDDLQGDITKNPVKRCPTCYKWIVWSLDKDKKQRDGFRARIFSFYTSTGKRITNQELTEDPENPRRERRFSFPQRDLNSKSDMTSFFPGKKFEDEIKISKGYVESKTWAQIGLAQKKCSA
jgi:hypothetical protein